MIRHIRNVCSGSIGFSILVDCITPALLALGVALPLSANANVTANATAGVALDDNVFRLPEGALPPSPDCRSDDYGFAQGQAAYNFGDIDPRPGITPTQWTGAISGSVEQIVFRCNTPVNSTPLQSSIHIASPQIGPVDFAINLDGSRRLTSFGETGLPVINRHTLLVASELAALHITPYVSLLLTPTATVSRNNSATYMPQNYNQFGLGAGIGYTSALGNAISVIFTKTVSHGTSPYFQVLDNQSIDLRNRTSEQSVDVKLAYSASVFTRFSADLGYAARTDLRVIPVAFDSLRGNYHGPIGNIQFFYQPNSDLQVQVNGGRQLASQNFLLVNGTRTDTGTVNIGKRIYEDVRVIVKADYIAQQMQLPTGFGLAEKSTNRLIDAQISVAKHVLRVFDVTLSYIHQQRLGSGLIPVFSDNGVQLQVSYQFGKPDCILIFCS